MPGVHEAAECGVVVKITLVSDARSNQVSRRSGAGPARSAPLRRPNGAGPVSRHEPEHRARDPAGLNGLLGRREGCVDKSVGNSCCAVQLAALHRRGHAGCARQAQGESAQGAHGKKPKACASRKSPSQPTASTGSTSTGGGHAGAA